MAKKKTEKKKVYYKGFDKDLKCRDFQYEIGKTYETDEAKLCESGFHACEAPLSVFNYYPPNESRYCEVELDGVSDEKGNDTKVTAKKITVGAEIGIPGLVKAHVEWVKEETKECKELADNSSGDDAQIGSSGRYAQIGSSGDAAQIGSSGYAAQIGSSGDAAQIGSSGRYAQIGSSGRYAQIGSSGYAAQIGSSGRYAQIGSSGDDAVIECEAEHAAVACAGRNARVKAPLGTWVCLAEYGDYDGEGFPCVGMKCARIDGKRLKADTWYTLKDGKFVKWEGEE